MFSRRRDHAATPDGLERLAAVAADLASTADRSRRPSRLVEAVTEAYRPYRVSWCPAPEAGQAPRLLLADGRFVPAPPSESLTAALEGRGVQSPIATGEWNGRTVVAWPADGPPAAMLVLEAGPERFGRGEMDLLTALVALAAPGAAEAPKPQSRQFDHLVQLGQASGSLVHELKSPLGGILSTLAVLRRRLRDDERSLEVVRLVEREVERLRDTVVNILGFIRADREPTTLGSLRQVVEQAATSARAELEEAGVDLVLDLDQPIPTVTCDVQPMRQAVLNLLANAREAMPTGGRVTLSLLEDRLQEPPGVVLTIRDSGPGFSPETLGRAFEPFITSKTLGTGLGLANVARIVADHGGRVQASNPPDGGARVALHLPLVPRSTP